MELRPASRKQVEDLLAFAIEFPMSDTWTLPLRRLLQELPSSDDCILDIWDRGERQGVAVVVDTVQNLGEVVLLEVLGRKPGLTSDFLRLAQPVAVQRAHAGGRKGVECYLPDHLGWGSTFAESGWTLLRDCFVLEREGTETPSPPLPPGFRWRDMEPADVLPYYHLLKAAFSNDPGMQLAEYPAFVRAMEQRTVPVRLLCRYEKILGFVRTSLEGERGDIDAIGRSPEWRGKGLGPLLMAEAARFLAGQGAKRMRLSVTGSNTPARNLYRSLGFLEAERAEVWLLPLTEVG